MWKYFFDFCQVSRAEVEGVLLRTIFGGKQLELLPMFLLPFAKRQKFKFLLGIGDIIFFFERVLIVFDVHDALLVHEKHLAMILQQCLLGGIVAQTLYHRGVVCSVHCEVPRGIVHQLPVRFKLVLTYFI
jgi:hypothetical protein